MGQAGVVSALAEQVEEIAADVGSAVPEHWTGRAAVAYQNSAAGIATGVRIYAARVHGVARLVHQHEQEAAAIRTALAGGGMAPV